jgi:hypothetical protein
MYYLLQLLLGVLAVYGALNFTGDVRLYVPLACLTAMFFVGRLDKDRYEKKEARKSFLKSELEKMAQKDAAGIKEKDYFVVNSLLWPIGELLLMDAVHFVLKDLGFKVATGGKYGSVDRIVKIPDSRVCFGLEILMSDEAVEKNHPKIDRALRFEKDKEEKEKTLIIASTYIHRALSERERLNEVSIGLHEFLAGCEITLITAYTLYQLWQKAREGEVDVFNVFQEIYNHPGGIFAIEESSHPTSFALGA